jgi:hypothetical protein
MFEEFFCFKKFSIEWLLYFIIELSLIAFFIVSCYNADKLIRYKNEETEIRNGLNIAIECVIIFVGFYIGMLWYIGLKHISKLQICFCGHIAPFLVLTGLAALSATIKRIE